MLYKPNFCCNCGEKIDRTEWSILSSRRFCPLCETENKGSDYFVRGVVMLGLISGVFGVAAWVRGPSKSLEVTESRPVARAVQRPAADAPSPNSTAVRSSVQPLPTVPSKPEPSTVKSASAMPSEPVYYCQAITKKGTRCTRRIKSPGFCWQHAKARVSAGAEDAK